MPTLALSNSLSFHQMRDPGDEFPRVRPWGTLGWIAAGYVVSYLDAGQRGDAVPYRRQSPRWRSVSSR